MAEPDFKSAGAWNAPERLSGARLALAGAPGADVLTWAARVSVVALAVSVVWWVWVIVRPLPITDAGATMSPPRIPEILEQPASDSKRAALIEGLTRENLYAADRRPWVRLPMASNPNDPASGQTAQAQADGQPSAAISGGAPTIAPGASAGSIAFTPTEQLPDDVKKALATLELKAVRAESNGGGVAMISFVHSATRQQSTAYRPGDQFKDEANPNAEWRVVAVDLERRRVLLGRSGVIAALPLYKGLGEGPVTGVSVSAASTTSDLTVVGLTRDEVIMDLRAKGLSEADILAVIEEFDRQLEDSGESPVKALGRVIAAPEDAAPEDGARRVPPAGMEAILQMMAAQSKQAEAKPDESEQKPARGKSPRRRRNP